MPDAIPASEKPVSVTPKSAPKSVKPKRVSALKTAPYSPAYTGKTYTKDEVKALIVKHSRAYGINPEVPLCIAYYESGYNQTSKNKRSSASGVFQYLSGTWKGTDEAKAGYSVMDADANVKAAIKYMASRRSTQPWEVRHRCPKL